MVTVIKNRAKPFTQLTDEHLEVLAGLHKPMSMRDIGARIHKSLGWVQILVGQLNEHKYVYDSSNGKKIPYNWKPTPKGIQALEANNLLKERTNHVRSRRPQASP